MTEPKPSDRFAFLHQKTKEELIDLVIRAIDGPTPEFDTGFVNGRHYGQQNGLFWLGRGLGYDGIVDEKSAIDALRSGIEHGRIDKRDLNERNARAAFEKQYREQHPDTPAA